MNVLCRVGLHKWRSLGTVGIVMPWRVEQCQRCERGRETGWTGTLYYTPEQMRAALLAVGCQVSAQNCTTHHYACDCRELAHTQEIDHLRQQLAAAEANHVAALEAHRMACEETVRAEAERGRAVTLLKRCATALKVGECDMHYHLPSGHRVSLLAQVNAVLAPACDCPGKGKPASLHAPNCPARAALASAE